MRTAALLLIVPALLTAQSPEAGKSVAAAAPQPLFKEDFESGTARWEVLDPATWKVGGQGGAHFFEITDKRSAYKPPHRSPFHVALVRDVKSAAFSLTARVQTTTKSYGHRDLVFVFGWQDAAHFYYVHLGEKTDEHANQIFIVNGADRTKISAKTTPGTPWKDNTWHEVKLVRSADGTVQVYFDDMTTPVMEAKDAVFGEGRFGIGSFDDTGRFDDIVITAAPAAEAAAKLK